LSVAPKISAAISRAFALISCSIIFSLRDMCSAPAYADGWLTTHYTPRRDFLKGGSK
jgi:hypothetical protein